MTPADPEARPYLRRAVAVLALGTMVTGLVWSIAQRPPGHVHIAHIGQQLPAFRLPLLSPVEPGGRRLASPADHVGQPLLLHLWAPSCPPCVQELPRWQALWQQPGRSVAVLTVAGDDAASVQQFLRRGGYTLPVAIDATGSVHRALQIDALPTTLAIDRQGRVVAAHVGTLDTAAIDALARQAAAGLP